MKAVRWRLRRPGHQHREAEGGSGSSQVTCPTGTSYLFWVKYQKLSIWRKVSDGDCLGVGNGGYARWGCGSEAFPPASLQSCVHLKATFFTPLEKTSENSGLKKSGLLDRKSRGGGHRRDAVQNLNVKPMADCWTGCTPRDNMVHVKHQVLKREFGSEDKETEFCSGLLFVF